MTSRRVELEVFRFRPDLDESESWDAFTVDCDPHASVLDALVQVQTESDPSLSFRWSCGSGQCGACGITVNDVPVLACETLVSEFRGPLRITPLANLLVVRDLICALEGFEDALRVVRPSRDFVPAEGTAPSRRLAASDCIECGLCYAACRGIARNPEFVGPAAMARAWEVMSGESARANEARREVLASEVGVWNCGEGGECSAVCPRDVQPARAASGIKLDLVATAVGSRGLRRNR